MFWSQFSAPTRPLLLNEKMVACAELHRLSGLAMRSVVDHLWPRGPRPDSYFRLVQQFLGVVSHIDAAKRSACIEGVRMALAHVKTYWAGMETTAIAIRGAAKGQDSDEHYFEEVLEGARLIEAQCSKMPCSSDMYLHCKNNAILIIKAMFILLPESIIMPPVRPFIYICI